MFVLTFRKPFVLALLLIAVPCLFAAPDTALAGFTSRAKVASLELLVNDETGFLAVRNSADGMVWLSSPLDWEADPYSSGFNKNAVPSLLSIRTKDKTGSIFPANSWINVVGRGGLTITPIENGVRFVNYFEREGITIPVDCVLDGNGLVLSVPLSEITEEYPDDAELLDLVLAPYFGAAPIQDEGYIFVPDGSGAIIRFNNRRSEYPYLQYVYGRDPVITPVMKKLVTEDVLLPVFGISRKSAGCLAVIEQGAARSSINAETGYQKSGYNAVSAGFVVRDYDVVTFREKTGTPRDVRVFEKNSIKTGVFAVHYFFLAPSDNSYAGMARVYRKYLQQTASFTVKPNPAKASLVVDFIGGGDKVKPVLGIPCEITVPYTPFADARATVEALRKKGVANFVVKYDGWTDGGFMSDYPSSASAESGLGGRKGFVSFSKWLGENGISFFPSVDLVNLYKSSFSHIAEICAEKSVNRAPAKLAQYRLTTFVLKSGGWASWLLKPEYVKKGFNDFWKDYRKLPVSGIALDSLGNTVGSDFGSEKGDNRITNAADWASLIATATAEKSALFSRPCDWALPRAAYVVDLPTTSSRFDIENESVPFYQMVLHGYVPYSNLPGNRSLDLVRYKLSLLESGAFPSYLWVTQHAQDMRDTRLECFMNVRASDWIDEAATVFAEVAPILNRVAGVEISRHDILPNGLRVTTWANGLSVVVNYSNTQAIYQGGAIIAPLSYAVYEGVSK